MHFGNIDKLSMENKSNSFTQQAADVLMIAIFTALQKFYWKSFGSFLAQ